MKTIFIYLSFLSFFIMFSTTFSQIIPEFQVNGDEREDGCCSSISIDESGNFVITWMVHYHPEMGCSYDFYAQRYSNNGEALGGNFKINDEPGSAWSTFGSPPHHPSISSEDNGDFIVTWWHDLNYDHNHDIYAQRYSSDGTAIAGNFKVNSDTSREGQAFSSISTDGSGNFIITWLDNSNNYPNIYAQRYSNNGTLLGSNFIVNNFSDSTWGGIPSISADDTGNFVIIWSFERDIYAQRYSADGSALGNNFKVNNISGGEFMSPSISTDGSGNFVIAWALDQSGNRNWELDIYAQIYSSDGTALGSNFKVNDDVNFGSECSVYMENSGDFVIAWTSESDSIAQIYAQRYSNNGSKIGTNFVITNSGSNPEIVLWNGQILTTWTDNRDDEGGPDIWANVLDWNNPVGISEKDISQIPSTYRLSQNYPNPFNPRTIINYELPITNHVELNIYNMLGQKVATLVSEKQNPGHHQVQWNASGFASGVYYYRIEAGEFVDVTKMILIR